MTAPLIFILFKKGIQQEAEMCIKVIHTEYDVSRKTVEAHHLPAAALLPDHFAVGPARMGVAANASVQKNTVSDKAGHS